MTDNNKNDEFLEPIKLFEKIGGTLNCYNKGDHYYCEIENTKIKCVLEEKGYDELKQLIKKTPRENVKDIFQEPTNKIEDIKLFEIGGYTIHLRANPTGRVQTGTLKASINPNIDYPQSPYAIGISICNKNDKTPDRDTPKK